MLTDPKAYVQDKRVLLDYQSRRMDQAMTNLLAVKRARTGQLAAALDAMSPLKVLGRGYAIAQKQDWRHHRPHRRCRAGERFRLRVSDGELPCRVEETNAVVIRPNNGPGKGCAIWRPRRSLSFEESTARLEEIVSLLERG